MNAHLVGSPGLEPALDQRCVPENFERAIVRDRVLAAAVFDQRQDIVAPVVVDETGAAGYLIGQAELRGLEVTDEDVVHVVDAHLAYLRDIGAVGPPADPDEGQRRS